MKSTPEIINISSDSSSDDEAPLHTYVPPFRPPHNGCRTKEHAWKRKHDLLVFKDLLKLNQNHQKTQPGFPSDLHLQWNLFPPFFTPLQMRMSLRTILLLLLKDHNHQGQGQHPEQESQTLLCQKKEKWYLGFHALGIDVVVGCCLLIPSVYVAVFCYFGSDVWLLLLYL